MNKKQRVTIVIISFVMGFLFLYGAYENGFLFPVNGLHYSYGWALEHFLSDLKLYLGIIFFGVGFFFWFSSNGSSKSKE